MGKEDANNKTSIAFEHEQGFGTMPPLLKSHPPRWEYMETRFNHISELDVTGGRDPKHLLAKRK